MEGVLMLGKRAVIAVRDPQKNIVVEEMGEIKRKGLKIPFVRGIVSLYYSLSFGLKALDRSAEISTGEEMKKSDSFFSIVLAIILAIGLFVFLPVWITTLLGFKNNEFLFSLVDGFIRLGFFLLYVWIISLSKDIKRLFMYHGAEHKTIHAFENNEVLEPKNIRKYSRIHPRCGSNFIMIFLIIAILLFSLVGIFKPLSSVQRIIVRIVFIPIIASISYEFLKIADKAGKLFKILYFPGMLLQFLTTAEPTDDMLEVAIASVKAAIKDDKDTTHGGVNDDAVELMG